MEPDPKYWAGKRVCVTGGTGFLGWHLVLQLLPRVAHVRVFGLRPASERLLAQLRPLDCIYADVRDPKAAAEALRGCDVVFHTAGTIAMFGPAIQKMYDIHVEGTRQILHALPAGARMVHTSSVVAVGAARAPTVLTEAAEFSLGRLRVDYVHAKKTAEDLARAAAGNGTDVVVVNPSYLIGPNDYEGSAMGRFCLRAWRGKIPLVPPGGLNFVDVRDVARGHLLAAERGCAGARYILAGENMPLAELVALLVEMRGLSSRLRVPMPAWLLAAFAWLAEWRGQWRGREPYPSIQQVRLCRYHWYYSSGLAERELGFHARPLKQTLHDTHEWYCREGTLAPVPRQVSGSESAQPHREAA